MKLSLFLGGKSGLFSNNEAFEWKLGFIVKISYT